MKKLFPVAIIIVCVALAAMFSSCQKSYTCTCTYDVNHTATTLGTYTFSDMRDDAQLLCNNKEQSFPNITSPVICDLK